MAPSATTRRPARTIVVLATMALVVLCLGLPNLLVACNQACCAGHVKLTTACEAAATRTTPPADEATTCSCCRVDRRGAAPDGERCMSADP